MLRAKQVCVKSVKYLKPGKEIFIMPEKPIVTANPKEERINELAVFTYAKKLSEYIFTVTKQSPKIYRWIVIDRLLNVPLELIELLYLANDSDGDERLSYQKRALSKIKPYRTSCDGG